jgi:hypothetical protein
VYLARFLERVERPLHGALAGSKRKRQGRARPRLTVGEKGKDRRMLPFDGRGQHDDLACAKRRQRKPSLRRLHAGQRPKQRAKPPDFDGNRARYDSSASVAPNACATSMSLGRSPGHASPSARASANNTGRLASETAVPAARTT